MTAIQWDAPGKRFYQTGIDQGVLYVGNNPGVAWNGLTAATLAPSGGDSNPFYVDGVKFSNQGKPEEFVLTINAFTYPVEFEACDGSGTARPGFFVTGQRRQPFGLCYRTMVGNEFGRNDYQLNLVYNATVSPTTRSHKVVNDAVSTVEFMWQMTVLPQTMPGFKNSSHIVLDTRYIDPVALAGIEEVLYGTEELQPRLPSFQELLDIYDTGNDLTVTDNGDGTFTATAPEYALAMLDSNTFELSWDTAVDNGDGTFTISSS